MKKYPKGQSAQVLYQGRWVDKDNFRAFVYNEDGKKLADSYQEYSDLIESGDWFSSIEEIKSKNLISRKLGRKRRDGSTDS